MPSQYNCYQCGKTVQIGLEVKVVHYSISSLDKPNRLAPGFKDIRFCSKKCLGDFGNYKLYKFADKTKEV